MVTDMDLGIGYAVFGLIDPRTEEMFWVGAGKARAWRYYALRTFSDGKERRIREIREAGLEPEPELIALCSTRRKAMVIKIDFCQRLGQAFRGSRISRQKDRRAYKFRHAGPLAENQVA